MSHAKKRIVIFSFRTRILYLILSSVFNYIIPDHEAEDVFISPDLHYTKGTPIDYVFHLLFGGLTHWDAQHFFHIAKYGYSYEHNLAFFPLYPNILSLFSKTLYYAAAGWLTYYSSLIFVSFCVNTILFTSAALKMYELSVIVLKNETCAYKATLFFCISPATIFFIAPYSESLFSLLVLTGMTHWAQGNLYFSAVFFGLGAHTRSNGLANLGFILHFCFFKLYKLSSECSKKLLNYVIKLLLCSYTCVFPYVIFQMQSYLLFCTNSTNTSFPKNVIKFGKDNNFLLPSDEITWCNNTIPTSYSYVQRKYWNVGFLKYYTVKQIPNFILALPIISIIISYSIVYLKHYWRLIYLPQYIYSPFIKPNDWRCPKNYNLLPRNTFVFVIHALVLTLFCVLFINIQVTTRLLCSSSPILYWIIARYFVSNQKEFKNTSFLNVFPFTEKSVFFWGSYLKLYFIIYSIVGTVLYSNNLPWT